MTLDGFDFEIDEEGIVRILDHDQDDSITFSVKDFAHFLTEFASVLTNMSSHEDEDYAG